MLTIGRFTDKPPALMDNKVSVISYLINSAQLRRCNHVAYFQELADDASREVCSCECFGSVRGKSFAVVIEMKLVPAMPSDFRTQVNAKWSPFPPAGMAYRVRATTGRYLMMR